MALTFRKLHAHFVAEVGPVDLRQVHDPETLARVRAAMDEYAVLVFHDQPFTDDERLEFAQRLDGLLHTKSGSSALVKNRFGNEAVGDVSNLDESGEVMKSDNRRRMYGLGNRSKIVQGSDGGLTVEAGARADALGVIALIGRVFAEYGFIYEPREYRFEREV